MDIYAASLPGCPRLGAKHMRELITFFETPEDVWNASEDAIHQAHILPPKTASAFLAYRRDTDPHQIANQLYEKNIRCCTWEEEAYPPLLSTTANPPAILFYRGAIPDWERTIAIVGSRKATAYGLQTARQMAKGLTAASAVVVSGGARGIDSAAHGGALEAQGPTVVVLACGLDRVYPPENRNLFQQVIDVGGTLLSEYPPGTPPLGRQFPARNRIIAGMSRGTLVVEAAERSGSLITADFALEEGRDVLAIPGSIYLASCKGTNQLIRHGAICCTSVDDILTEYGWNKEETASPASHFRPPLTLEEEMLYRYCCQENEVTSEEILQQSGLTVVKLTMLLLQLQLKGYIQEVGSGRFILKD